VTALTRREGERLTFSTATGVVSWRTHDVTDLDYGPMPLVTRDNREEALQFSQEVRLASSPVAPGARGSGAFSWQAGAFVFTQSYTQDAVNGFSPFLLSPFIDFPVSQHAPESSLDDVGIGVFGHATLAVTDRLDVSGGLRVDHESKEADLGTFFAPAIQPRRDVSASRSFSSVSPQVSAAFDVRPDRTVYVSAGRAFKAGGFNPASPVGSESYGEEQAWHSEAGVKSRWAGGRATVNAAVFHINWTDLQLNLPDPAAPGQFYIANVGGATSAGVEVETSVRLRPNLDLVAALGHTSSRFKAGSVSLGVDVSDNTLPGTPDYTAMLGLEASAGIGSGVAVFGRADTVFYGAFKYDDANTVGQDAYALVNLRAGLQSGTFFLEAWVRNALDTHYIPVAFAYDNFAPSGFVGEPGRPRTFGISGGVGF
jgi:iron complex outermembrane receptor protein